MNVHGAFRSNSELPKLYNIQFPKNHTDHHSQLENATYFPFILARSFAAEK